MSPRPSSRPSGSAGGLGAGTGSSSTGAGASGSSPTSRRGIRRPASGRMTRWRRSPTSATASAVSTAPGRSGVEQGTGGGGQGPEPTGADLHPEAVGHHLLDLVGLVEDDHLVGREHGPAAGQVGAVQVGVDHHHVGLGRPGPGVLGEAVVARRAAEGARALAGGGRDHGPGPEVGLELELGPVAGGGVLRPTGPAAGPGRRAGPPSTGSPAGHRSSSRRSAGRRRRAGRPAPGWRVSCSPRPPISDDPLAAQVVAPSLEHGEGEVAARRPRPPGAGPWWPAGPGGPWWRWPPPPAGRTGRRGSGRPGTCRCRCRPGPPGAGGSAMARPTAAAICLLARSGLAAPGERGGHLGQRAWPPRRSSDRPYRRPRSGPCTVPPRPISATRRPGRRPRPGPTITMTHRSTGAGSRRPIAAADLAADDRPGGDQPGHRPRDVGGGDEEQPGHRVDHQGQAFLVPLRRWRSSSMKMASRAMRMTPWAAPK